MHKSWSPVYLTLAVLVGACSGGGSGELLPPDRLPGGGIGGGPDPAPGGPAVNGRWSAVMDWPLIPIHATLLPDGRVFTFGTDDGSAQGQAVPTGFVFYDLWNPNEVAGVDPHIKVRNFTQVDTFCAAQLVLPVRSGDPGAGVLVVGGDTFPRPLEEPDPENPNDVPEPFDDGNEFTTVMDYTVDPELLRLEGVEDDEAEEQSLKRGNDMAAGRWYATATTLLNGEIYVQGGNTGTRQFSGELFPEVRSTDGVFRRLGLDTSDLDYYYPRNFIAPDGLIFGYDVDGQMYRVDPGGAGTLTLLGELDDDFDGTDTSVAMFAPGRVLHFGGGTRRTAIIDFSAPTPQVTDSGLLSTVRRLANATLLPNGQVLATGGSLVYNETAGTNNYAEFWDPVSGGWTRRAQADLEIPRLYHSIALLLADGRVLVGGGGAPGPATNLNAEIYSPPYLFNANGSAATRPSLSAVPETVTVGRRFSVNVTSAISRVALVKTGAVTHGLNMDQRYLNLPFTRVCSGPVCRLEVDMPSQAADVPPGYYLLFVLNANGTPSLGKFVFVNVAAARDPAQDPTLANPGNQGGTVGTPTTLALAGSDPNTASLTYAASGLPPGLTLDAANGRIDGAPTAAGRYDVMASVSDGERTANANFVWTIQ